MHNNTYFNQDSTYSSNYQFGNNNNSDDEKKTQKKEYIVTDLKKKKKNREFTYVLWLVIFIFLFISSTILLIYFQFYIGNGKWHLSFDKKVYNIEAMREMDKEKDYYMKQADSLDRILYDLLQKPLVVDTVFVIKEDSLLANNNLDYKGIVYEVQIGSFTNFDFEKYATNMVNMYVEIDDRADRLTIGRFRSKKVASIFLKDIRELGFKKAWIVKKEEGERRK